MAAVQYNQQGEEVIRGKSAVFGLYSTIALYIGLVVGSGVFSSAGPVYQQVGTRYGTIVTWIVSGIVTLFGAFSYSELGASIPEQGGDHVYLYRAFGSLCSFLFSWSGWISRPTVVSILALTFSQYARALFTGRSRSEDGGSIVVAGAVLVIIVATLVSVVSREGYKRAQDTLAVVKVCTLIFLICTGFYYYFRNNKQFADDRLPARVREKYTEGLNDVYKGGFRYIGKLATSYYLSLWGYDGWTSMNLVVLDMENPVVHLPIALVAGVSLSTSFYALMNFAYFVVLDSREVVSVDSISSFGMNAYGQVGRVILLIVVCIFILGATSSAVFCNSEVCFVASADHFAPRFFSKLHPKFQTPVYSLMFQSACAIIFVLAFNGSYIHLINFYSIPVWIFYVGSVCSLIRLRYKEPNLKRPLKIPIIVPAIFVVAGVFMLVFSFFDAPIEAAVSLGFIAAGIPVWHIFVNMGYRFVKQGSGKLPWRMVRGVAPTTNPKYRP